jgi:hypothetical protein
MTLLVTVKVVAARTARITITTRSSVRVKPDERVLPSVDR